MASDEKWGVTTEEAFKLLRECVADSKKTYLEQGMATLEDCFNEPSGVVNPIVVRECLRNQLAELIGAMMTAIDEGQQGRPDAKAFRYALDQIPGAALSVATHCIFALETQIHDYAELRKCLVRKGCEAPIDEKGNTIGRFTEIKAMRGPIFDEKV